MLYNDNDPQCCAWLRELIRRGHLPAGTVDERSVVDIPASDCPDTCHFFAGIGGWPYALRLAGWSDNRPVWTASLPCQPFSAAGKGGGFRDSRNLWPHFHRLVRERKPSVIFGEQVAGAVGFGWLDRVFADLEADSYACGAVVLGAHSVRAPHIRQRLFWVADRISPRLEGRGSGGDSTDERVAREGGMAGGLGDAEIRRSRPLDRQPCQSDGSEVADRRSSLPGFWSRYDLIPCLDGKSRRIEPGTFPLAHGIPARVGRLRGYGNAIVPQVAAEFVKAFMQVEERGHRQ